MELLCLTYPHHVILPFGFVHQQVTVTPHVAGVTDVSYTTMAKVIFATLLAHHAHMHSATLVSPVVGGSKMEV